MKNIVNICFITDTNYAVPTGVAIESLIKNCNKDTQYNVYVIAVGTNKKLADKFKKLKTDNVNIDVINTKNIYDDIQTTHQHVSKAAMIKFNIPNMFPNLDKILYLDGDMLFFDDLYYPFTPVIQKFYAHFSECRFSMFYIIVCNPDSFKHMFSADLMRCGVSAFFVYDASVGPGFREAEDCRNTHGSADDFSRPITEFFQISEQSVFNVIRKLAPNHFCFCGNVDFFCFL